MNKLIMKGAGVSICVLIVFVPLVLAEPSTPPLKDGSSVMLVTLFFYIHR